jgi:hypothetical protein
MTHKTIPPKAHTWQADAETSHSLIEYEFYTIEAFNSTPHLQQTKAHTWQADAETSHSLIEYEFYTIEAFNSTHHLQQKMGVYLLWFNFLRKNSYKENQTPLQIGLAKVPELNSKIADFKPAILDYSHYDELNIKDHHVGYVRSIRLLCPQSHFRLSEKSERDSCPNPPGLRGVAPTLTSRLRKRLGSTCKTSSNPLGSVTKHI